MKITLDQYPIGISGSFIITAIGSDGIIIASESRANIFDRRTVKQTPLGYFDTIQKIFPNGNLAIAETGQGLIGDTFFSAIINDFYSKIVAPNSYNLLSSLIKYAQENLPVRDQNEFLNQRLFSAGYDNSVPHICSFNNQQTQKFDCKNNGYIQSDNTIFSDRYSEKMNCQELAGLAEMAITNYASHSERWKTIGGPISVLKITERDTKWILNEPQEQKWTNVTEFISDYKSGNVEIDIIEPHTRDDLHSLMGI